MTRLSPIVLALSLVGCSFGMETVPSRWTPETPPNCDVYGPPVVDILVATVLLSLASVPLRDGLSEGCREGHGSSGVFSWDPAASCTLGLVVGLPGLLSAFSGVRGAVLARKCSRARERRRVWLREHAEGDGGEVEKKHQ